MGVPRYPAPPVTQMVLFWNESVGVIEKKRAGCGSKSGERDGFHVEIFIDPVTGTLAAETGLLDLRPERLD